MNARKLGIGLTVAGGSILGASVLIDWIRYRDDDALAASEGIFDFSVATHVVFFVGLCLAGLGALTLAFGGRVLSSQNTGVKVLAALFAVGLVGATAAVADASKYADSADEHGHDEMTDTGHDHGAVDSGHDDGHDDGHDHGTPTTMAGHDDGHDHGTPTTMAGHDHGSTDDGHGHETTEVTATPAGEVIIGTADGTSPCEIAAPTPGSPGQVGAGDGGQTGSDAGEHGHRGFVKPYSLTAAEQAELIEQMDAARTVIERYPTVADALAAGYSESTVYVPCIGAHYTNISKVAVFDPAEPSELLYDGTAPDSKIIGLSFLVVHEGGPPEGFAGQNDIWHQHNANGGLCLRENTTEVIGGEDVTEEECEARGGFKAADLMANVWMVHAWVAPGFECSWGVFAGECPELGGRLGGTAWDAPDPNAD
jgi:hypothetical protein